MDTYWISFRIKDDATYAERYDALVDEVRKLASPNKWWIDTTAFIVFACGLKIGDVANRIRRAMGDEDIALVGMPDFKSMRVIGLHADEDIFDLVPFAKYA